jgi:hypothetical protein
MNWACRDIREKRGAGVSKSDREAATHQSRPRADTYRTRLLHFRHVGLFLSDSHREQVRQGLVMGAFLSLGSGARTGCRIALTIFARDGSYSKL